MEEFQLVFQVVTAIFFLGAIPWGFKVVSELSRMRANLEGMTWMADAIKDLQVKIHAVELKFAERK